MTFLFLHGAPTMPLWQKIVWLALAGVVGTLARFGLSTFVQWLSGGHQFPWGTMAVNLLGCFLLGVVFALSDNDVLISPELRFILSVGFMGAFTTFSAFAFETSAMLRLGHYWWAAGNMVVQNVLGLAMMFAGIRLGQLF